MKKSIFKFSTLRNPKEIKGVKNLLVESEQSEIIKAIESKKSSKEVQKLVSKTISSISTVTKDELFGGLVKAYNHLASSFTDQNTKKINPDSVLQGVQRYSDVHSEGYQRKITSARFQYGNLLTAIKLSSNRTQPSQKSDFIDLLKAWSMATMFLNATTKEKEQIAWLNVYSSTYIIPIRTEKIPIKESEVSTQKADPKKPGKGGKLKHEIEYKNILEDYKDLLNKKDRLEFLMNDVSEVESMDIKKIDDSNIIHAELIKEVANSPLFSGIADKIKSSPFKTLITGDKEKKEEDDKVKRRLNVVLEAKSKSIINSSKEIFPDLKISSEEIKTGAVLDTMLAKKVEIESEIRNLEFVVKDRFDVVIDPKFLPKLPKDIFSDNNEEQDDDENGKESLFELLISDLILVDEEVVGYIASDIAHIENALAGETRSRQHRTLDRSERSLTFSEGTQVRQHLNLGTNSRQNFQAEIDEATKRKFGGEISTSASFQPANLKIDARVYYDDEKSKLEKTINESAKEVTEEARIEVTRKIHQERSEISINEVEIINDHEIVNPSENGHMNGIYQWVDQVKEMKSINYGRHLMAKFIIPDPAKLLFKRQIEESDESQIAEFPLRTPYNITDAIVAMDVGKEYGVTNLPEGPVRSRIFTKNLKFHEGQSEGISANYILHNDEIPIPLSGYEISRVELSYSCPWKHPTEFKNGHQKNLDINIMGKRFRVGSNQNGTYNKIQEPGGNVYGDTNEAHTRGKVTFTFPGGGTTMNLSSIPINIMTRNANYFQGTVNVHMRRYDAEDGSAVFEWQREVYNILYQAYLNKKEDMKRKKKSSREEEMLVAIRGANPEKNKMIIKDELKRQVIRILSEDSNHTFKGFFTPVEEIYDVQINEMKKYSQLIDFFENAIDWEKISYKLHPYFWHDNSQWIERQQFENSDPHFEAFMKAGAAETIVPIKRGFERSFVHYIEQGEPWNHNEPLSITSEENNGILSEVNEFEEEDSVEVQIGSPWRVRIPTSLIILSEKNKLDEIPSKDGGSSDG